MILITETLIYGVFVPATIVLLGVVLVSYVLDHFITRYFMGRKNG